MLFSVGIETPKDTDEAFGLVVPALCTEKYDCYSAADTEDDIAPMVTEAIQAMLSVMQDEGYDLAQVKDAGVFTYQKHADFAHCDNWLLLHVDTSAFEGKPKRINISIPDTLISRIDYKVKSAPDKYRDRSHFLATAARHELEQEQEQAN